MAFAGDRVSATQRDRLLAREAQRRRTRRARRRAALAGLLLVVVITVVLMSGSGGTTTTTRQTAAHRHVVHAPPSIPAVEAGLLPWHLPTPLSREVVVPTTGGHLVVLGGLKGSVSERGVLSLDSATGHLHAVGSLPTGVHDAGGAVIGDHDFVFGGGSPTTVPAVESFATPTPGRLGPFPGGSSVVGHLAQPRSDLATATIGRSTYIVGGYDGANPDPQVLATTDGQTFRTVANLPVPVRYPAVAALGGKVYVFGGERISGAGAGQPVNAIQVIDPRSGRASIAGRLPEPLEAAAAMTLGGHVYLAGGDSTQRQQSTPGVGRTQISSPVPMRSSSGLFTVSTVWALNRARTGVLVAGRLQVPVSHAGLAVLGGRAWLVGGESGGTQLATVQMIEPNRAFGPAGAAGAGSPYYGGHLLVADRANNRLLVLTPSMQIVWRFPSPTHPRDSHGFYFPDDAFFASRGTAIVTNQEGDHTIQELAYPSGRVIWAYGHKGQSGAAPGYLYEPDDAYLLKNGQFTVADADNCRVLVIAPNHQIVHQIGTAGDCVHHPPRALASPNGDTPLPNGDLLVSEIAGSIVSEYTPTGRTVWSVHLPIGYPSDPQQLGPDRYLIADYVRPGQILEFNRAGKILYRYDVSSGPGLLKQPSLVERLPSGVFMVNDDYRHRVVAIDPVTKALVWQYGITDRPGRGPGMLRIPDGFDVLMANGSTPTHPTTG